MTSLNLTKERFCASKIFFSFFGCPHYNSKTMKKKNSTSNESKKTKPKNKKSKWKEKNWKWNKRFYWRNKRKQEICNGKKNRMISNLKVQQLHKMGLCLKRRQLSFWRLIRWRRRELMFIRRKRLRIFTFKKGLISRNHHRSKQLISWLQKRSIVLLM